MGRLFPLLLLLEGASAAPPAEGAQRTERDAHPGARASRVGRLFPLLLLLQGASAAPPAEGACPPGSAGVSPAYVSAQPPPFPPPGATGKHATALLRPGSGRSRRRRWRVIHRRHTERIATAVHAGGTPALPGGRLFRSVPGTAWPFSSNPTRAATAPGLCFGRVHAVPAGGVVKCTIGRRSGGCTIVGILSESLRQCMRARRPRSRVGVSSAVFPAQPGPFPPTRLDRQRRQGSASAGFTPFLPAALAGDTS